MTQIVQALTQLSPLIGAVRIFEWMNFNFNSVDKLKKTVCYLLG
jgi:hypothetical protein